jgi:hypothetical protein
MAMAKKFRLKAEDMKPLGRVVRIVPDDRVRQAGGFMYREKTPDNETDSGWRFLSGLEDQDYMDEADNHGVYDVNTIANYDPSIIELLDAAPGSVFERTPGTKNFRPVDDWAPPED